MIKLGGFFKRRKLIIAIAGMLVIALTATLFLTAGAVNGKDNDNKQNSESSINIPSVAPPVLPDVVLQTLWNNKTAYIGDNSKVGALIKALGEPSFTTANGFSLSTSEAPYGLTIQYIDDTAVFGTNIHDPKNNQRAFKFRALILMCLIDNADFVNYEFSYAQSPMGSFEYTREWADTTVRGNLKDFTKDFNTFKSFVNSIYSDYLPLLADFNGEPQPSVRVNM